MRIFDRIYTLSMSKNRLTQYVFWGVLVGINSLFGFILSGHSNLYGKIFGILTWFFICIFFISKKYQQNQNTLLQKSILMAYLTKTLLAINSVFSIIIGYGIWDNGLNIIDILTGAMSMGIIDFVLGQWFGIGGNNEFLYTYTITLLDGLLLNSITILFGYFLYFLRYTGSILYVHMNNVRATLGTPQSKKEDTHITKNI